MRKTTLITAGTANVLIGILHIVIVIVGPDAYIYFGAGQELAVLAAEGSIIPTLITLPLAVLFMLFGLYGFSGADAFRPLPLLRTGLWFIGGIYTLRGLILFPLLVQYFNNSHNFEFRYVIYSAVSLIIGLLYLIGATLRQKLN